LEAGVGIEPASTALQEEIACKPTTAYSTIPDKTARCNFE